MWEKMETKTIVYDLDTSGGLMEVRVALIPFPQRREETSAPQSRPQARSARGPGRGGFFLTQSLPPIFAIWGTELSFRGRLQ